MAKKPKQNKNKAARSKRENRIPWRVLTAPILIVAGVVVLLVYLAFDVDRVSSQIDEQAEQWAVAFWRTPIPPQGKSPEGYIEQAKSLNPEDCGICHPAQFSDWKASLHGIAMGPGVMGQFPTMHPAEVNQCRDCHTPMYEQYSQVVDGAGNWRSNGYYDADLEAQGLVCSACHLRNHRRHGPPLVEGKESMSHLAHGEPLRTPFFEASEFCKSCHQHPTTSMKVNGKVVENTYLEWLQSPYPAQGITCQTCHMPERRHLWKGIHDKEMTLKGVTIDFSVNPGAPVVGERVSAELTVTNTGTGHAFPTYTTPAVFLRAAFKDADGQLLRDADGRIGYYQEITLQRRLDMSVNPWREAFDTRLLPGQSATLEFRHTAPENAKSLNLWVWVDPDHFYNGFFRARLRNGANFPGGAKLQKALRETVNRRYLLWSRSVPVEPGR